MADLPFINSIVMQEKFFKKTLSVFDEKDANFTPKPEMFTVAQHVAHVAHTVDWFMNGAFDPKGMDTNFEEFNKDVLKMKSLAEAKAWLNKSFRAAEAVIRSKSIKDFEVPIAGHILGGVPRHGVFEAMADHTAHHRGALAVYARLAGKTPAMPYDA